MIEFQRVTSKNFYAIGNQPLTVELNKSPSTLVIGGNGSGKTSATIEAIMYCLFGKPYRQINISGIVNSTNKNNCVVETEFKKAGILYKVVRGEKPKKFEIYKDNEIIPKPASSKDYQEILEEILGMNHKIFSQVVVLNKSKFIPFMGLSVPDRRYVVEEFLDINIISSMLDITKKRNKNNNNDIKNKEHDASLLQKDIDNLDSLIRLAEHKDTQNNLAIETQITFVEDEVICIKQELDLLNTELSTLIDIEVDEKEKYNITEERTLNTQVSSANSSIKVHKSDINRLKNDAVFFKDNEECPTCSSELSDKFRKECIDKIKKEATKHSIKIQEYVDTIKHIEKKLSDIIVLKNNVSTAKNNVSDKEGDIRTLNEKISNLHNNISRLKSTLTVQNDNDDIQENINELKLLTDNKKILDKERESLYNIRDNLKIVEGLFKEDGIKADIVKQYLPVINSKVNEYLSHMGLSTNFILDNEFNEHIDVPGKEKYVYYNFSDGQKTRIDLALLLTWIYIAKEKNSINTNLLILDEILEALDITGIHDFLNTVKYVFDDVNLFVISQRKEELADCFKSQIGFKLVNGFTEITGDS